MTATRVQVGGKWLDVIADEPAPSRLTPKPGKPPIYYTTIRSLLLEDGSTVYGCGEKDCNFASTTAIAVIGHRQRHTDKPRKEKPEVAAYVASIVDSKITADDVIQWVRDAATPPSTSLTKERDEWKARAERAEADLAALRQAIAQATGQALAQPKTKSRTVRPSRDVTPAMEHITLVQRHLTDKTRMTRPELRALLSPHPAVYADAVIDHVLASGTAYEAVETRKGPGRPRTVYICKA